MHYLDLFLEMDGQTIETPQPEFWGSKSEVNDHEEAAEGAAETPARGAGAVNVAATCARD